MHAAAREIFDTWLYVTHGCMIATIEILLMIISLSEMYIWHAQPYEAESQSHTAAWCQVVSMVVGMAVCDTWLHHCYH